MCSLATFSPFLLEKARRNGLWSTNGHGNRYINARKASHFGAHAQPKFLHGHECKSIGRQKWNILTAQTIPPVRLSQPSQPFLTVPAIPAVPPTRTIQTTPKQIPNRDRWHKSVIHLWCWSGLAKPDPWHSSLLQFCYPCPCSHSCTRLEGPDSAHETTLIPRPAGLLEQFIAPHRFHKAWVGVATAAAPG